MQTGLPLLAIVAGVVVGEEPTVVVGTDAIGVVVVVAVCVVAAVTN